MLWIPSDKERIETSKQELMLMLEEEELKGYTSTSFGIMHET